jgi:hypothetical protein
MAFTILSNGDITDASQINDNFYHVAQGSRLPMGGVSLAATTLTYDLGTTTAYWNNLYCNTIYCNSITTANKSLWTLVSEVTLTATASSIEFTGLNGDTDKEYKIFIVSNINNTLGAAGFLILNGDSTTNNYGYQNLAAVNTVVSASRGTSQSGFYFSDLKVAFGIINLYAKTGLPRMSIMNNINDVQSTTIYSLNNISNVWNNTTSTVTTLKFYMSSYYFLAGTHIELWKRG